MVGPQCDPRFDGCLALRQSGLSSDFSEQGQAKPEYLVGALSKTREKGREETDTRTSPSQAGGDTEGHLWQKLVRLNLRTRGLDAPTHPHVLPS